MISKKWGNFCKMSKAISILCIFWLCAFLILSRLLYLQIGSNFYLSKKGESNILRVEVIPPLRGDIFDCRGVLLAANRPLFDLYWQGDGSLGRYLTPEDVQMLQKVSDVVGDDFLHGEKRRSIEYAHKYSRRKLLMKNLSFEQLCQISEQCGHAAHLVIENRFKRVYPFRTLASHILGYLSREKSQGQAGIEHLFHKELRGREGYVTHVMNATGKKLRQTNLQEAESGSDISLTIDSKLQQLAEDLFEGDFAGSVIVMDPVDGAVKALACNPAYDPNLFLERLTHEEWSDLVENRPFINRATNALYPPASIFKLVTIAAGLEEGIIEPESQVTCWGHVTFYGRKYYCTQQHGRINVKKSLAHSCNVPCFEIAPKLSIDVLAQYARRFGLGSRTGFLLPEKGGLVPTSDWKYQVMGERWWTGENLSACIGQGYLLVTPLQIARMVSGVITGYLAKPRLLMDEKIACQPLDISEPTLQFLRESMRYAVTEGNCWRLNHYKKDFAVHAKTGTAQTCSRSVAKTRKEFREHAWLASYFSYQDESPLTLIVLLEHSESSKFALQMARKFLSGYRKLRKGEVS